MTVAVVGAGPAGLAAARVAAGAGCTVTLIDAGATVGGQIWRQSTLHQVPNDSAHPPAARIPARLQEVTRHSRVRHLANTSVWHAAAGADGGFVLRLAGPDGGAAPGELTAVHARAVVVATGATELVLPFPGWDLPGVTTAGAAQALLKSQGVTAGQRVIVAGTGPLLLPVAAGLATAGVRVLAVLEAARATDLLRVAAGPIGVPAGKVREAAGYAATLARYRVPVRWGYQVTGCSGDGRVQAAEVARAGRDGYPVAGPRERYAVDAVHVSFGFSPALELARALGCVTRQHPARPVAAVEHDADQATSVPGVFAAGEVTGIGGADVAELEGALAGAAAARYLGVLVPGAFVARTSRLRARLARARRFAALLDRAFPLPPWPVPGAADTVVCRCEEVRLADIHQAAAAGARDVRAVKGLTRCGMGWCQGRICGPLLQQAAAQATGRTLGEVGDLHGRPVMSPVSLGLIADTGT